jgi:hypothetical protein
MTASAIRDIDELENRLSEPTELAIDTLGRLDGDIAILGVGGKMGPTLARMARRASDAAGVRRRVIGVSRFSSSDVEARLQAHGVETIRCDLLDQRQLDALPDAPNVLALAVMKFGATGQEARTWAMNCYLPGMIAQRFRTSRIVAFSTGNVYGLTPVHLGGSCETDPLSPVGEYALSCVGRERIYEHFSRTLGIPMALLRLNYANELRYGVLADLARKVLANQPIDLTMGYFNAIWQADANALALCSFDRVASPPFVVNVAGPETLSVRSVAERFGQLLGRTVTFTRTEAPDALLSNAKLSHQLFGPPRVSVDQLMEWIAGWVLGGGTDLGKPTRFEIRDGRF